MGTLTNRGILKVICTYFYFIFDVKIVKNVSSDYSRVTYPSSNSAGDIFIGI